MPLPEASPQRGRSQKPANTKIPQANVTIPGGDFKRFAQFARRCLVSVGVGHANRAKGNAWELPKKFEGRVPLFLNRLMGLPVDQQKLVSLFLSFPYERLE